MRWQGKLKGSHLPDWLARRARLNPRRPALIADRMRMTFAELDQWATATAARFVACGVEASQPIALLLRNTPEFAAIVHAAPRIPAKLVPLNTRLTTPELSRMLSEVGAKLLVYDEANTSIADSLGRDVPELRTRAVSDLTKVEQLGADEPAGINDIDLSAVHTIVFTSGTSGRPKGAMLTYGNHWWSAVGAALDLKIHDDDRWLAVLPFFHVGGLAILIRCVVWGIPAVVHEEFDPAKVNRSIDEDGVTVISVVANMLQRMLDQRGATPYPDSLRCVLLGGGPAPRALLADCARHRIPVVQSYGLTETASLVVALSAEDALRKPGSSGQPLMHATIRIERDGQPCAPGEIGEIVVAGPTVATGYVNSPGEFAHARSGDWFRTGDLGYVDDEGYLYVVDRRGDLIITGGENVYPAEVEEALLEHPDIVDVGVVGEDDDRWGQAPAAFVQVRDGAALDEFKVIEFGLARLARYKAPRRVRFVASLPRNAAGKLLRGELRRS